MGDLRSNPVLGLEATHPFHGGHRRHEQKDPVYERLRNVTKTNLFSTNRWGGGEAVFDGVDLEQG
jgi:hypothetical protein